MEWNTKDKPQDNTLYAVRYRNGIYAIQPVHMVAWEQVVGWIKLPDFPSVS